MFSATYVKIQKNNENVGGVLEPSKGDVSGQAGAQAGYAEGHAWGAHDGPALPLEILKSY